MKQTQERRTTARVTAPYTEAGRSSAADGLALWQLNLLRVGYAFMGIGLAVFKWPLLIDHEPWGLAEGTKECMLIAMSVLALLGLRHPARMLPILLFEVAWKLLWLGAVALPLWSDGNLEGATRQETGELLLVAVFIAVIPWRHVFNRFATTPGEPWVRSRQSERR
jgi:alkylhydroperoxidase/carboxymuconolactone decarboxylase family protein YurZ